MPVPSARGRIRDAPIVVGVDGCRGGWVAAVLDIRTRSVSAAIVSTFEELMRRHLASAAMTIVDMPIGLADAGRRDCERQARKALGRGRASSVFAAPRRPMLDCPDYATANALGKRQGTEGGGGLSRQAWGILPKIKEIDAAIGPRDQARLGEGHPEVAFLRLGGAPCRHSKRTREGLRERHEILTRRQIVNAQALLEDLKKNHRGAIACDDVFDACALALTAEARLAGEALRFSNEARDARGLVMEIWG